MKTRELRQRRATIAATIRSIVESAEKENRGLTAEEQANYDKGFTEQDELRQTIERAERQQELDAELAQSLDQDGGIESRNGRPGGDREDRGGKEEIPAEYRANPALVRAWEQRGGREYNEAFRNFLLTGEKRALSAGTDSEGGYTIVPMQFADGLLKAIDNLVFIRPLGGRRKSRCRRRRRRRAPATACPATSRRPRRSREASRATSRRSSPATTCGRPFAWWEASACCSASGVPWKPW